MLDHDQRRPSSPGRTIPYIRRQIHSSPYRSLVSLMTRTPLPLLMLLLCTSPDSFAAPPLWWSETMPHAEHGSSRHSHGGPVEIRRGIYHKNLWLRNGEGPADAQYLDSAVAGKVLLKDVKGAVKELAGGNIHGSYGVNFAMPDEGYYNLYLVNESVTDGMRQFNIAKSEVLKHSCREGHDHVKPLMTPRRLDTIPLEIVRERMPAENFHTSLGFGDTITFLLLYQGAPLPGAEITLHTAHGWRNSTKTDAGGRASFMLIRDYYPPWHEFERRHRQDYVVNAVHVVQQAGTTGEDSYTATRYLATLNGSYYPSSRDYRSYAYGLLVGIFALTATGVGVYLYRRRRQRRFHEVRFDDKH